ncbi:cobalt ABC transporter ATP-binding protein [Methanosarcinales archaeon]|nr:MAG: cobalt ABC transporter ATP-binding protein [Methanosarcinales archaeon]
MMRAIEVNDVWYRYPNQKEYALKGINFEVEEGEKVAIIGANGAGKSTLLLHFNGILKPERGEIKIMGDSDVRWMRSKVGLVFQNPDDQLFCPTVFEDVAFGPLNMGLPEEEVVKRVENALKAVGLSEDGGVKWSERAPHHLSYGERQRVAIATVLSMGVDILVLDEPTSNLDPKMREDLMELLLTFPYTVVVATHDIEFAAEVCERIVVMDKGEIVEEGVAERILSDMELLRSVGLRAPTIVRIFEELGIDEKPVRFHDGVETLKRLKQIRINQRGGDPTT